VKSERAKRRMGEVMSFDSAVSEAHYFVDFVNYVHSVHLAATPLRRFALSPFRPFALSPLRSPYPLKIAE
jgi:hypothetical protein